MDKFSEDELRKYGNLEKIQQHQEANLAQRLQVAHGTVKDLKQQQHDQSDSLDALIAQAENLMTGANTEVTDDDVDTMKSYVDLTAHEQASVQKSMDDWSPLPTVELSDNWDGFEKNLRTYASAEQLDLSTDPLTDLLTPEEREQIAVNIKKDFGYRRAHCDKYDYTLATISGVISGLIDVFFVGGAMKTKNGDDNRKALPKITDSWFNHIILKYAQMDYHLRQISGQHIDNFPKQTPKTIEQGVHYLEMQYKVPYDAQYDKRLKGLKPGEMQMSAANHHLFSLAHYPDLVGLVFSILDQFLNTGSYLSNGQFIQASMENNQFKLHGSNFAAKIFCGFVNWMGHLASDAVGSSGAVHKGNRGSGLPIPGTEIFQTLNFNLPGTDSLTLSKIATKVFEQGYDARHAAATAIPVMINELLTRLLWALKQYFYHHQTVSEITKLRNVPELSRMLLCSYGVFAGLDIGDATAHGIKKGIETGGNKAAILVETFSNLNVALYPRLALQGYKEVMSWYNNSHYNVEDFDHYLGQEWESLVRV